MFLLNQLNQERLMTSSRNQSSSRKAVAGSSVRATSSADFAENRTSSRLVPSNGRSSTTQRTQFAPSSSSKAAPSRIPPDVTLEFLSIGNGKRKWWMVIYLSIFCWQVILPFILLVDYTHTSVDINIFELCFISRINNMVLNINTQLYNLLCFISSLSFTYAKLGKYLYLVSF